MSLPYTGPHCCPSEKQMAGLHCGLVWFFLPREHLEVTHAQRLQELQESRRRSRVSLATSLPQTVSRVLLGASEVPQSPAFWGVPGLMASQDHE